eukprot:g6038.t1
MLPPPLSLPCRRVVVTGLGVVSPLAVGAQRTWELLVSGASGVKSWNVWGDAQGEAPVSVAARVPRGNGPHEYSSSVSARSPQSVSFIEFAQTASREALNDAGFSNVPEALKERTGVAIGSGIGNIEDVGSVSELLSPNNNKSRGYRGISPYFVPRTLINLAAGHVAIEHGLRGPNHACANACASGANSLGDAFRFIQRGDCDMMIAGGSESCINPISIAGFARAKALTTKNADHPEKASRPFDSERSGFVMGEGSAIMILEEREMALARGANIYAEIRGYGLSGDAHHITLPSGEGAIACMRAALQGSGLELSDVDYVNAHATSTPRGDQVEFDALCNLFRKENAKKTPLMVSSTKGAVGHLLGAAGALEAVFSVQAIKYNVAPPTLNLETPLCASEECSDGDREIELIHGEARKGNPIRAVLSNSFGFGGTNASLLFSEI